MSNVGAAAGSTYYTVSLRNDGKVSCTLEGYPGVSLVGGANGTQIGRAADRNTAAGESTVSLAQGASTTFTLQVAQAGNYSSGECQPTPARGMRIYPPANTGALFLARSGITACAGMTAVHQLTVGPIGYHPN